MGELTSPADTLLERGSLAADHVLPHGAWRSGASGSTVYGDSPLQVRWLGRVTFDEARAVQEERAAGRRADGVDELLLCEHPPTISCGRRTEVRDLLASNDFLRAKGVALVNADRGGGPTYHGPGQLVLYPVVCLRTRRLGVRSFVQLMLEAVAETLQGVGVPAEARLEPAGVWVEQRKVASVGLRVKDAVTLHGFAVNVSCPLDGFTFINPCGLQCEVTSIERELLRNEVPFDASAVLRSMIENVCGRLGGSLAQAEWCAKSHTG